MNYIFKRLSILLLTFILLFSTVITITPTATADNTADSGNISPDFFKKEYWEPDEENVAAFNLADGSVKLCRSYIKNFGSYKNDGFETMFKCVGGFELTFRANEDASEGYVFGIYAPSHTNKGAYYSFYLKKANGNSFLAQTNAMPNHFTYGDWVKLGVKFNDSDNKTEMIISINDIKLDFYISENHYNPDFSADFENIKFENGNLIDQTPFSKANSYIKVNPYYNGGFESSPNKDNQVYFASVDKVGKIQKDNYVTKIAVVGDSITQGVGSDNNTTTSYVAQLQKMLGPHYDVYNCGASANSVMSETYQPYTIQVIYYSSMLFNPDYIIFALGTNDGQSSYWDRLHYFGPSIDSTNHEWRIVDVKRDENGKYIENTTYAADKSISTRITVKGEQVTYYFKSNDGSEHTFELTNAEQKYIDQANALINTYTANSYRSDAHAKIIISSVMKTWGDSSNSWNRQKEVFDAQNKLADKNDNIIGFIDNYSLTEKYDEISADNHYMAFSNDGLHPNVNGHELLAKNIFEYISKNLDIKTDDIVITYGPKTVESESESSKISLQEMSSSYNSDNDTNSKSKLKILPIILIILFIISAATTTIIIYIIYIKKK